MREATERPFHLHHGGKPSLATTTPLGSPSSSSTWPTTSIAPRNTSSTDRPQPQALGDKLQWMALYRPHALQLLERVIDGLIARYDPSSPFTEIDADRHP